MSCKSLSVEPSFLKYFIWNLGGGIRKKLFNFLTLIIILISAVLFFSTKNTERTKSLPGVCVLEYLIGYCEIDASDFSGLTHADNWCSITIRSLPEKTVYYYGSSDLKTFYYSSLEFQIVSFVPFVPWSFTYRQPILTEGIEEFFYLYFSEPHHQLMTYNWYSTIQR